MFARFNLFILMLIGFIDQLGLGLVYPLFAVMLFDQNSTLVASGTSDATRGLIFGLLIGTTPISQFFSAPMLGALSDKKGRREILKWGLFTGVVGYIFAVIGIVTGNITLLFVYRLLVGVSDGTAAVAHAALADISTDENKSRHFSLFNMALGAGFALGPFIGGKLSDPEFLSWATYSTPFYFAGTMSFLNMLLVMFKFPESRVVKEEVKYNILEGLYNIKRAFFWKELRFLFLGSFAFVFGWSFFHEFIPLLLRQQFNFQASGIGDFYGYCGFWYALSTGLLTAPLVKRYAPEKIVPKALVLLGAYMPVYFLISEPQHLWLFLPLLLFLVALVFPTSSALISNCTSADRQGEVLGIHHSVIAIAIGLSPIIAGAIVAEYPLIIIWGGAIIMFTAGLIFLYATQKPKVVPVQAVG